MTSDLKIVLSDRSSVTVPYHVAIAYSGATAQFPFAQFKKARFPELYPQLFVTAERYANHVLSDQQKAKLLELYSNASTALHNVSGVTGSFGAKDLPGITCQIIDMFDLPHVEQWIVDTKLPLPPIDSVPLQFVANIDAQTSRDRTYIQSDYIALMAVVLVLKFVLPIWGHALGALKDVLGVKNKELSLFSDLTPTALHSCDALHKLRSYVEAVASTNTNDMSITALQQIGSEQHVELLVARMCVRVLSACPVEYVSIGSTVCNYARIAWSFIKNASQPARGMVGGNIVTDKKPVRDSSGEVVAITDQYRPTQAIAAGEIAEINYMMEVRAMSNAKFFWNDVPEDAVERSIAHNITLFEQHHYVQDNVQRVVTELVLAVRLPAQAILMLERKPFAATLGALQAAMVYAGHGTLAAIMTATLVGSDECMVLPEAVASCRVEPELYARACYAYPYTVLSGGTAARAAKEINPVLDRADQLAQELQQLYYSSTLEPGLEAIRAGGKGTRQFLAGPNIRNDILRLLIHVAGMQERRLALVTQRKERIHVK